MSRRESMSTITSIGLLWVEHIYIIMRTIWQRRNASRSLSFILLWILFSNVAMYQSYIHNIAKYVVLTFRISLKNLLFILLHFTLTKLSYISIFDLSLVLVEQFYMHSWRNGDDETQMKSSDNVSASVRTDSYCNSFQAWMISREILRSFMFLFKVKCFINSKFLFYKFVYAFSLQFVYLFSFFFVLLGVGKSSWRFSR